MEAEQRGIILRLIHFSTYEITILILKCVHALEFIKKMIQDYIPPSLMTIQLVRGLHQSLIYIGIIYYGNKAQT